GVRHRGRRQSPEIRESPARRLGRPGRPAVALQARDPERPGGSGVSDRHRNLQLALGFGFRPERKGKGALMSFDIGHIWQSMTIINKGVIFILILMSIYSLTVTIERFIFFNKARKQSLAFARGVTGFLKNDNLQGAIDSSKKFTYSHVARVVAA